MLGLNSGEVQYDNFLSWEHEIPMSAVQPLICFLLCFLVRKMRYMSSEQQIRHFGHRDVTIL